MSTLEIDLKIKVKINDTEQDFSRVDVAETIRKLLELGIKSGHLLGDDVHEDVLDNLITYEITN